jgi:DNA-binding response OmpR family regulator
MFGLDRDGRGTPRSRAVPGPGATILLVEDDTPLAEMLSQRLRARGYDVRHARTAAEAEVAASEVRPALVILDLMLPDQHGLVVCANLRERCDAPIIICSATKHEDDVVLGFRLGADDFVRKPFSADELEARVEAALRRTVLATAARSAGSLRVGELVIDPARRRATVRGEALRLTPTEYRLLAALADRPDEVVSPQELAQTVWGQHDRGIERSLGVHLRRLRAKLPVGAPQLLTVRGFGYRLAATR